jgi:predicted DNA-binding transcriptional regulator AlpA
MPTTQEQFDLDYITCDEIQRTLNVSRASIFNARKRGLLPDPVQVRGVRAFIWEREKIAPYIAAWKISLASRRGELK